jgi:hypothetical protein
MADYPLRKNVGRGLAGLSRASNRDIDPREVQAMFADVASGMGIPLADAGAKYLRGDIEGAKESAAIEGALSAIPLGAIAAKPVYRAAKRAVPGALEATRRMAGEAIERGTPVGQMLEVAGPNYVVKPKGGNWVTGGEYAPNVRVGDDYIQIPTVTGDRMNAFAGRNIASEYRALNESNPTIGVHEWLKSTYPDVYDSMLGKSDVALNSWLDKTLTKYIKNEMGTAEDRVRLGADAWAQERAKLLEQKDAQIAATRSNMQEAMEARTLPDGTPFTPEMMTRSQEQLRQLQKERDYIAAQKGTHLQSEYSDTTEMSARRRRSRLGVPVEASAKSPEGMNWEAVSDLSITQAPYKGYGQYAGYANMLGTADSIEKELEHIGGKYAVENPKTMAYGFKPTLGNELGFGHMVDEMQNALNPASGLPPELLIDPDDLAKMSVANISKHVDKINAWRGIQQAEANRAIAGNAATHLVKEYPEAGKRWVELRPKQKEIPEGYEYDASRGEYINPFEEGAQPIKGGVDKDSIKALEEALRYEGEQLSHCVGGYCPDVESGNSRIFSLRTEEGKPQATIEVQPWRSSQGESLDEFERRLRADPDRTEEDVRAIMSTPHYADSINQIKGLSNRPPSEQVDFVLDFLAEHPNIQFTYEGKKDLTNLGVVDTDPKHGTWRTVLGEKADQDAYMSSQQMESAINDVMRELKEVNSDLPRFVKRSEFNDLLSGYEFAEGGSVKGYAQGGSVGSPFNFEHISILADAL